MNGEIIWYSPAKRYGFVAPVDGGGDIVFALSASEAGSLGAAACGLAVHFLVADSPGGPEARHLAPGHVPEL